MQKKMQKNTIAYLEKPKITTHGSNNLSGSSKIVWLVVKGTAKEILSNQAIVSINPHGDMASAVR